MSAGAWPAIEQRLRNCLRPAAAGDEAKLARVLAQLRVGYLELLEGVLFRASREPRPVPAAEIEAAAAALFYAVVMNSLRGELLRSLHEDPAAGTA